MINTAVDKWGRLDVLFNNAGIMHAKDGGADETEEKIWDLTQAINVKGVWYGCKHGIAAMRKVGYPVIQVVDPKTDRRTKRTPVKDSESEGPSSTLRPSLRSWVPQPLR